MSLITSLLTVTLTDHAIQRCREIKLLHATGSKDRETDEKGTRADKKNGGSRSVTLDGNPLK